MMVGYFTTLSTVRIGWDLFRGLFQGSFPDLTEEFHERAHILIGCNTHGIQNRYFLHINCYRYINLQAIAPFLYANSLLCWISFSARIARMHIFLNNGFCFHFFLYSILKPYENKIEGFACLGWGGSFLKFRSLGVTQRQFLPAKVNTSVPIEIFIAGIFLVLSWLGLWSPRKRHDDETENT